ncbi:GLMPB protein, partial [Onychorhynchus coronatus]|nr:GLMPB protein [Onychorhynchus coronatus]
LEFNPGWNSSSVNVLHVRAEGSRDTLHFVWSSLGAPAVLLVASESPRSRLGIHWPLLLSPDPAGALWIDPPGSVSYASAVVFTKLFEEKAPGEGFFPPYDLAKFSWENSNLTLDQSALRAQLRGIPTSDPTGAFANGSLTFEVRAFPAGGRGSVPPALPRVPGSCGLELRLQGLRPRGNGSRLLLELAALEAPGRARALRPRRHLDDEFAPGVFEVTYISFVYPTNSTTLKSRPNKPTTLKSRPNKFTTLEINQQQFKPRQGPWAGLGSPGAVGGSRAGSLGWFGVSRGWGSEWAQGLIPPPALSRSVLVGFGEPPRDTFSPLIISIMAVALGTPLALLLGGSGLVLLARRRRYSEYEPIN